MAKKKKGTGIKKTGGVSNVPRGLLPEQPFRAPLGSYDPGLDAAERASGRGLIQLITDLGDARDRAAAQYGWGQEDITRGRDEALGDLDSRNQRFGRDLGTARQRGGEDYTTGKTRLSEDFQSSLASLARNYQRLGNSQRQGATAAGVQAGGALRQAARKRAENQAWDRKPIDTGFARGNQDLDTGWNRQQQDWNTRESDWNTDYQTDRGRITDGATRNSARLTATAGWDDRDRFKQEWRAQGEHANFQHDTQEARIGQVQQTAPGYLNDWNSRNRYRGFRTF